jgi:predicted nucleotidyltransferase
MFFDSCWLGAWGCPLFDDRYERGKTAGQEDAMNRLPFDEEALARLCRRHRICQLSLFGSVLKGSDRPGSDVDLLVEFEPGVALGLLGLAAIEAELSDLLGGRRVDLHTWQGLSR